MFPFMIWMKFTNSTLYIDRELSDLDRFTLNFVNILEKHTNYVIVSGYVAILLGRARASEDIDIIIPKIDFSTFRSLYHNLKENDFYCLNAEKDKSIFDYLKDDFAIRFAKKDSLIPNIELKCEKNKFDKIALEKTLTVKLPQRQLYISHLELQIAFKEVVLKSPTDIEDARHIRDVAEGYLDDKLIQKYKEMLCDFY